MLMLLLKVIVSSLKFFWKNLKSDEISFLKIVKINRNHFPTVMHQVLDNDINHIVDDKSIPFSVNFQNWLQVLTKYASL